MTVKTSLGVYGTIVCDLELTHGIVVDLLDCSLLGIFCRGGDGSGQHTEGQPHEDTVEPHLIGVDGLVPKHVVGNGARLILQLLHHRLHSQQVLGLGPLLIHACDEVSCADVVKVIIEDVVASDVALGIDHRVGELLTVFADILTTVFQVGVEHAFKFYSHHVTPFGLRGEIKQITFWHTLHLRVGQPLAVVFVRHLVEHE